MLHMFTMGHGARREKLGTWSALYGGFFDMTLLSGPASWRSFVLFPDLALSSSSSALHRDLLVHLMTTCLMIEW